MKNIIALIIAIFIAAPVNAATYYVATDGTGDYTSLAQVDAATLAAGDNILFRRGDTFRGGMALNTTPGAAGNPIYFGAYGTGAKPLLLGSEDRSATTDWAVSSGSVWISTAVVDTRDVGNLVFNFEESCGIRRSSLVGLLGQGQFYFNPSTNYLYVYSASNPGTFYKHIEVCKECPTESAARQSLIEMGSYQTYENLDFRYFGGHGLATGGSPGSEKVGITVRNCDFSWGGGAVITGTTRYGNGLQFWKSCEDCLVEDCSFYQIYDEGFTIQGDYTAERITVRNCVIQNCFFGVSITGTEIIYTNNSHINPTFSWSHNQRSTGLGAESPARCLLAQGMVGAGSVIKNNICIEEGDHENLAECFVVSGPISIGNTDIDYNCYYKPQGGTVWRVSGESLSYTADQFAAWQAYTGDDAHSIYADPLLTNENYLREGSPCIGAGTEL